MDAMPAWRLTRLLTFIIPAFALAACGTGDGPEPIAGTPAPAPPPAGFCDPINFEDVCETANPTTIVNFAGGKTTPIPNPDMSGINMSDMVAQHEKFPDAPGVFFGGSALKRGPAIDFSQGGAFTIKVWSPRDVRLVFKLEAGNPVDQFLSKELEQTVPGTGTWEELCYDFSADLPILPVFGIVVIFDNGEQGLANIDPLNWTFYFDDITQVESCPIEPVGPGAPITPEAAVYATDPGVAEDLFPPGGIQNFDSGAVIIDTPLDPDYNPALSITSGDNYDPGNVQVGFAAFPGYTQGFAAGYETLHFKVKGDAANLRGFEVKFFVGGGDGSNDTRMVYDILTDASVSASLGNGWYQVSIPLSAFATFIDLNDGFLLGPDGNQGAQFTFLMTDIGFSGGDTGGGPADPGIIPEVKLYDRGGNPDLVIPDDYAQILAFDSGATLIPDYMGDADFSPAYSITTGFGYDKWNAQLAYIGFAEGFAAAYETLQFKVKDLSGDVIRVKLLPDPAYLDINVTSSGYSTALGNGWYQISVPVADVPGAAVATGLLFETIDPAPAESFTYLLTDIGFSGTVGGGGGGTVLATFDEAMPPAVTFFGAGASGGIEAGPAGGDGNALRINRNNGNVYDGAWVAVAEIPNDAGDQTISALVYSPLAGIPMVAKVEYADNMGTGDVQANEAVVVGWQTLTWTFTNLAPGNVYNRFSILPNLGTADNPAQDYFFDNITLLDSGGGGGPGGDCVRDPAGIGVELATNGGFESGDLTCWEQAAPAGATIEVVDTGASEGTNAVHLVASTAQTVLIKQFELAQGFVGPGDSVTVSFDLKGTLSGIGGVVFAEFFSEGEPATGQFLGGGPFFPMDADLWVPYSFDITTGADVSRGISLQFAAICGGDECGVDVFIDNVSIVITSQTP